MNQSFWKGFLEGMAVTTFAFGQAKSVAPVAPELSQSSCRSQDEDVAGIRSDFHTALFRVARDIPAAGVKNVPACDFEGTYPPPSLLKQYEYALPGATERMLSMAEECQYLRHAAAKEASAAKDRELEALKNDRLHSRRMETFARYLGMAVTASSVAGAAVLAVLGGQTAVIASLLALPTAAILYSRV